jgi:hypothetical protein
MRKQTVTGVTPKKYLQIGHLGNPGNGIKTISAILLEAGFKGHAGETPVQRSPDGMSGLQQDEEHRWRADVPYATAIGRLQSSSSSSSSSSTTKPKGPLEPMKVFFWRALMSQPVPHSPPDILVTESGTVFVLALSAAKPHILEELHSEQHEHIWMANSSTPLRPRKSRRIMAQKIDQQQGDSSPQGRGLKRSNSDPTLCLPSKGKKTRSRGKSARAHQPPGCFTVHGYKDNPSINCYSNWPRSLPSIKECLKKMGFEHCIAYLQQRSNAWYVKLDGQVAMNFYMTTYQVQINRGTTAAAVYQVASRFYNAYETVRATATKRPAMHPMNTSGLETSLCSHPKMFQQWFPLIRDSNNIDTHICVKGLQCMCDTPAPLLFHSLQLGSENQPSTNMVQLTNKFKRPGSQPSRVEFETLTPPGNQTHDPTAKLGSGAEIGPACETSCMPPQAILRGAEQTDVVRNLQLNLTALSSQVDGKELAVADQKMATTNNPKLPQSEKTDEKNNHGGVGKSDVVGNTRIVAGGSEEPPRMSDPNEGHAHSTRLAPQKEPVKTHLIATTGETGLTMSTSAGKNESRPAMTTSKEAYDLQKIFANSWKLSCRS